MAKAKATKGGKAAKKPASVATEEVPSTKQILEHGTADVKSPDDGTREVETTKAVFEDVNDTEEDRERGAHKAVFIEGEPRAADDEK